MTKPNANSYPWQAWHLTAYVLGELEPQQAAAIGAAARQDPALSAEIAAIRQTLDQVSSLYADEARVDQPRSSEAADLRWERLLNRAGGGTTAAPPAAATSITRLNRPRDVQKLPSHAPSRKKAWFAVLAMVASLMVAAWYIASAVLPLSQRQPPSLASSERLREQSAPATAGFDERLSAAALAKNRDAQNSLSESATRDSETQLHSLGKAFEEKTSADELPEASDLASLQPASTSTPAAAHAIDGRSLPKTEKANLDTLAAGLSTESIVQTGPPADQAEGLMLAEASGGAMGMGGMGSGAGGGEMGVGGMEGGAGGMMGGYGGEQMLYRFGSGGYPSPGAGTPVSSAPGPESLARKREYFDTDASGLGVVPETNANRFEAFRENAFQRVADAPLSTFSIDVDSASYAKCRQLLMEANQRPPAAAVRIEEFINYFDYDYAAPELKGTDADAPFAAHLDIADCPWRPEHKLVRIGLQAPKIDLSQRPAANIVFLLDVSGSMNEPNKLPLVKESMRMLIEQLGENDRLAMVVYAGAAGCVLESTRGDQRAEILGALDRLAAGGSTNGGDGIQLAYNIARDHYIPGGINRVILCTDGDFNVGLTDTAALVELVVKNAQSRTFLTVLGFGMGNTNDAMMEQISNRGNGVYGFVDTWREAKRQMVQQLAGNLLTVAKDVKIQVDFNPQRIKAYRLLGYENRVMAAADFNNDKKDAGEIGAGHCVTALYEIVPVGIQSEVERPAIDRSRYELAPASPQVAEDPLPDQQAFANEWLAVKLRYKQPEGDVSQLAVFPLKDDPTRFDEADQDFRWAASVAEFAMLLRGSQYAGNASWSGLLQQATAAAGTQPDPLREECLQMIRRAAQ